MEKRPTTKEAIEELLEKATSPQEQFQLANYFRRLLASENADRCDG